MRRRNMACAALLIALGLAAQGCAEGAMVRADATAYYQERMARRQYVRDECWATAREQNADFDAEARDKDRPWRERAQIRMAKIGFNSWLYPSVIGTGIDAIETADVGDVTCFGTIRTDEPELDEAVQEAAGE